MATPVTIINREHDRLGAKLTASINMHAPHGGGVVDEVRANGVTLEPSQYGVHYSETDAHISVRGLPVSSTSEEVGFDVTFMPLDEYRAAQAAKAEAESEGADDEGGAKAAPKSRSKKVREKE